MEGHVTLQMMTFTKRLPGLHDYHIGIIHIIYIYIFLFLNISSRYYSRKREIKLPSRYSKHSEYGFGAWVFTTLC